MGLSLPVLSKTVARLQKGVSYSHTHTLSHTHSHTLRLTLGHIQYRFTYRLAIKIASAENCLVLLACLALWEIGQGIEIAVSECSIDQEVGEVAGNTTIAALEEKTWLLRRQNSKYLAWIAIKPIFNLLPTYFAPIADLFSAYCRPICQFCSNYFYMQFNF